LYQGQRYPEPSSNASQEVCYSWTTVRIRNDARNVYIDCKTDRFDKLNHQFQRIGFLNKLLPEIRRIIFERVSWCTVIRFDPASEHQDKRQGECKRPTYRCCAYVFDPSDGHDQDIDSENTDFEDIDFKYTDSEDIDSEDANLARHFDYLQTCRQVYNEAFGLFFVCNEFSYCINDFVPESGEYNLIFLRELHFDQSRLIKTLELTGSARWRTELSRRISICWKGSKS
jgi:hypothetical protein